MLDIAGNELSAPLRGHEGPVTAIRYLPDGAGMVTSSWDETIRLWNSDGEELATIDAGVGLINGLAVSDDGLHMLTAGDTGIVRLWGLYPGGAEPIATLAGHRAAVIDVAFSPNGVLAASVALDGEVRVWDITPSGRGEIAAWAGDGPATFSPDGTTLAVADPQSRNVTVRPAGGGQPRLVLPVAPYTGGTVSGEEWGIASSVEFSPDGRYLASTSFAWQEMPGSLTLWDVASGVAEQLLLQHPFLRGPVNFSGDGNRIAVATCTYPNPSSTAAVVDIATGDRIFATPNGLCGHAADLDPQGERLAVSTEDEVNNVSVWDLATGQVVAQMTHSMPMGGVVRFSPDGTRLLTTGRDGFGRIWDTSSADLLLELEGHTGPVQDGIWISDRTAATVSGDGTTRLWDTRSGENVLTLPLDRGFPHVASSPDGRRLATSAGGYVQVWTLDLDELLAIARGRLTRSLSAAECVTYHFEECPVSP
jgi:WD40 repeat protein